MQLLDLTSELLDQIIDWTLPHGFESFALTCKTAYWLCKPRVHLHNNLKSRWRDVKSGSALTILHYLAKEPLISRYIQTLSFSLRDPSSDEPPPIHPRHEDLPEIKALVINSPYFQLAGVDSEDWWQQMLVEITAEGRRDRNSTSDVPFATIALLLFLPELRQLQMYVHWGYSPTHGRWYVNNDRILNETMRIPMLDALAKHSHDANFSGQSFHNLETILPFMGTGYDRKSSFGTQEWFVLTPTVKEFFGISLLATDFCNGGTQFDWHIPDLVSNVRRLELAYCNMDENGISNILSRMPKLEIFKYGHECKHHGCGWEWNPGKFIEAVADKSGNTITEMAFSCDPEPGAIENGVADLRRFTKLRRLEIDVLAFMGPPISTGQMRGTCGFKPDGATQWEESELPCLATMLPPSIEHLHLNTLLFPDVQDKKYAHAVALKALLNGFEVQRKKNLPKLTDVVVRQFNSDTAKKVVEEAGCDFENWIADGDRFWMRQKKHRMPRWLGEFEDRIGYIDYQ